MSSHVSVEQAGLIGTDLQAQLESNQRRAAQQAAGTHKQGHSDHYQWQDQ